MRSFGHCNNYAFIFTNGRIWNPRGRPKQGGPSNEGCMTPAESKQREVCIMHLQPATDWSLAWGSLHNVILPDGPSSAWYMVIHGITPTNVRLPRIGLTDTENCTQCGRQDTILHRLTECGMRPEIWEWTSTRIARIQRADPRRILKKWLLRPCFKLWP